MTNALLQERTRTTHERRSKATSVIVGLMRSSTTKAIAAGEQPPVNSTRPGADQVPDAFDVAHDARHERAGLVRVVVGDREAADVGLHLPPQLGDRDAALPSRGAA